jgi:hypothetical protein
MNPMLMKQASQNKGEKTAEAAALPENMSVEDIDALMARLNDDQVRRLLIAELQADAATASQDAPEKVGGLKGFIRGLENATQLFVGRAYRLVVSLPTVPADLSVAVDRLTDLKARAVGGDDFHRPRFSGRGLGGRKNILSIDG